MRVFVLGYTGMLGRYVYTYLKHSGFDVVGISRQQLDAAKVTMKKLKTVGGISSNDVIINCIGLIKQRKDISDLSFIMVNTVFPQMLAEFCDKLGSKLIHPSSDCCFKGDRGNYKDTDLTDAVDIYGRTKALGEPKTQTVIRTSIIGEEIKNGLSLIEWVKSQDGKTVNGYANHFWNGITCLQFAKVCEKIIKENLFWQGIKQITSPIVVSKCNLVNMIAEVYNLSINVNPLEPDPSCDRTLIASDVPSLKGFIPPLKEQLIEQKDFYPTLTNTK